MSLLLCLGTVCLFLVLSQLSPGPDVFFVFRTALARGWRGGAAVSAGINVGFCIQALIVCTAGRWVLEQPWSRWVLVAAACWLLYLAWKIFPRRWAGVGDESLAHEGESAVSLRQLAWQGFLCNILNPKCGLFIAGIVLEPLCIYGPQYAWFTPVLVAALVVSSQLGWLFWCLLLQWHPIRSFYVRNTAPIDAVFALLLGLFAALLLIP